MAEGMTVARELTSLPARARSWLKHFPLLASVLFLIGAFLAPAGLTGVDETIFYAGADAFHRTGGFIVENGATQFAHDQIRLYVMVLGPNGLTPQYPAGSAILGGAMMTVFGIQGLIIVNGLAAIATLFTSRALARQIFDDELIADLTPLILAAATFWPEFAFAVWPHATSIFCVTAAVLFGFRAIADADGSRVAPALLTGFFVGLGLLFRLDTLLIIPCLGLCAIIYADRPIRTLLLFAAGLTPMLAIASAINFQKFGSFMPVTYGKSGSGFTSLTTHLLPAAALILGSIGLYLWRLSGWKRPSNKTTIAMAMAVATGVLAFAPSRSILLSYLEGAWAMVVDIRAVDDNRPGVIALPGSVVAFWGHIKQALGQSMPWIGGLLLLIGAKFSGKQAMHVRMALLVFALYTFPLFIISWHGGPGNNVRYLGPLVPILSALCAFALLRSWRWCEKPWMTFGYGAVAGVGVIMAMQYLHPGAQAFFRQPGSSWFLLAMVVVALAAILPISRHRLVKAVALASFGATFVASYYSMASSVSQDFLSRYEGARDSRSFADLPERSLVIGGIAKTRAFAFREGYVATLPSYNPEIRDSDLIEDALSQGYSVFIFPWSITEEIEAANYEIIESEFRFRDGVLLKIVGRNQ